TRPFLRAERRPFTFHDISEYFMIHNYFRLKRDKLLKQNKIQNLSCVCMNKDAKFRERKMVKITVKL
ncbi:MAG: hypothetical protein M1166_06450, partial [Candidatus Thermoplasmatota archaeon]|nr:hypothetical protein [Candidatus Thermoplasmatota archaeon]